MHGSVSIVSHIPGHQLLEERQNCVCLLSVQRRRLGQNFQFFRNFFNFFGSFGIAIFYGICHFGEVFRSVYAISRDAWFREHCIQHSRTRIFGDGKIVYVYWASGGGDLGKNFNFPKFFGIIWNRNFRWFLPFLRSVSKCLCVFEGCMAPWALYPEFLARTLGGAKKNCVCLLSVRVRRLRQNF